MSEAPRRRLADIDWSTWTPTDAATLVFILSGSRVLLIRKKRGLGAGKINGPGGRIEPGETPLRCAVREVEEELRVTPTELSACGTHRFQFVDGYGLYVHVFVAAGHSGEPVETDEAVPLWAERDAIPYAEMWQDDALWLPHVLGGSRVDGTFLFEGDRLLDHSLTVEPRHD